MRCSLIAVLWGLAAVAACTDDGPAGLGIEGDSHVETYELPEQPAPKLDILFVIDDTTAMAAHQDALTGLPGELEAQLTTTILNVASYHLAVVTTDAAGGGVLRRSDAVADAFIVHDDGYAGPDHNYDGSLADAFASLVPASAASTAANQPLETMQLALGAAANAGFLREDAALGLVTITASDDASSATVAEYASALKAVEADPTNVVAIGIYPPGAPRLDAFHAQFPNRSETHSIDVASYADALGLFAQLFKTTLDYACNPAPADLDPVAPGLQWDCSFVSVLDGVEHLLPQCGDEVTGPCWELVTADPQNCTLPGAWLHLQTRGFTASSSAAAYGDWYHPEIRGQCVVAN